MPALRGDVGPLVHFRATRLYSEAAVERPA